MPEWPIIVPLVAQCACAVFTVEMLRRRVFGAIHHFQQPRLIHDVWAPLALVLPMMFLIGRIDGDVRGVGWIPIGAPVFCAVAALGLAALVSGAFQLPISLMPPLQAIAAWTGAGVLLLLLGAAHHLTLWMGQCAFAVAAMLLWFNTPDEPATDEMTPGQLRAGFGMTLALAGAIGQGMAAMYVNEIYAGVSGAMMIATAAASLAAATCLTGPNVTIRLGGWSATYGILLGLGLLSLMRLFPEALHAARNGATRPINRIAFGFGSYWIEGAAMLFLAATALVVMRQPTALRRLCGIVLIGSAVALAGWRLAQIQSPIIAPAG